MDYKYIVAYRLEGISSGNLDEDKVIYQDDMPDITVTLTKDINRHCEVIDTGLVCAGLLLRGMFGGAKIEELPIALESGLEEIQKERISKHKNSTYAVIVLDGDAELNIDEKLHRETDQFRICFDAIDKESLRNKHNEVIRSIIASLAITTSPEYNAVKIATGLYFIDENEKPLFSYTFQGGSARLILAKPIDANLQIEISKIIDLAISSSQLKTPFRLFTQSLEITNDNLRAFLSAWSSLEILTNKVFSFYEDKFVDGIAEDHNSDGVNKFLDRIKDVMKDKYRLTDKFALIASFLSDEPAQDIEQFKSMKIIRDTISHGKEFDEGTLPIEEIRKLSAKYLRSHLLAAKSA